MLIGHLAVGFAFKRTDPKVSLGLWFLAAVLLDLVWAIFVLMGIETVNIVRGVTASNPFEFTDYPYTHSLIASVLWAGLVYLVIFFYGSRWMINKRKVAFMMSVVIFSHFILDWIVHKPDLAILPGGSFKMGLGLWDHALISYIVEGLIFIGGVGIYLKSTRATTPLGKYGIIVFSVFLLIANLACYNEVMLKVFIPVHLTPSFLALFLLSYYLLFSGIAFWLDRQRDSVLKNPQAI